MPLDKEYFESYRVGERFETPSRTLTETDLVLYCSLTGNWHPLHCDAEYAKKTMFGERIADGWLVLSLSCPLAFRLGYNVVTPKSFIANLGVDNLRFLNPLKIGDTFRAEFEVIELTPKGPDRGIITYNYKVLNQRDEILMEMTWKYLVGRRKGALPLEPSGKGGQS